MVPAFNESDTIIPAIHSLVNLDYPAYEVIVIDDGSKDDTYAKALSLAGDYGHCTVRVITKPNAGKWSALNRAYHESKADYLLCVDADSRLSSDALRMLVPRLSEPGVVGVAGQVTVRNRDRLLNRLQAAEYLLGNGGMRMALSYLGLVTVVPGPVGLYRRSVLEEIQQLPCNQREAASHGVGEGKVEGPFLVRPSPRTSSFPCPALPWAIRLSTSPARSPIRSARTRWKACSASVTDGCEGLGRYSGYTPATCDRGTESCQARGCRRCITSW